MELYFDCGEPRLTHRTVFTVLTPAAVSSLTSLLASAGMISTAAALSLGAEQVASSLGQPLSMTIPLLGSSADILETRCFRLVTPSRIDGLSVLMQARIELQTNTNPPQLVIRSNRPVDEPVVRITIEAGCDAPIRRDYTVLLDPPPVRPPEPRVVNVAPPSLPTFIERAQGLTGAVENSPAGAALATRERAATRRAARSAASSATANPTTPSPAPVARRDKSATTAAARAKLSPIAPTVKQIQQDKLEVQGGATAGPASAADIASLSALAVPRLRIASDLVFFGQPGNQLGAAPVDELQAAINKDRRARLVSAPIESDLAPRLEADLVVAQRRLAELQSQLAAAGIAGKTQTAAAVANKPPIAATTVSTQSADWDWQRWAWIPGVLLVVGLIAFLLRQRRHQASRQFGTDASEHSTQTADDEITVVRTVAARSDGNHQPNTSNFSDEMPLPATAAAATAATAAIAMAATQAAPPARLRTPNAASAAGVASVANAPSEPKPIIATRAEREASDRLNNPLFQLRDTESHVDVSELSQVTDEAQVYADLGRNDQAIELLRDHIDSQTGELTSPAPWLMIFDLYRRTNNRRGYDELAPQFRKHFNGRVPDWDNYGHELALDDGLEAFPHLVARIERDWGTGEARKFLEELLYDNRGGSRLGFSLAAYRDILLLLQVHEGLTAEPDFLMAATDWESRGANDSDGTPKWDLSLEMIEPPKSGELESFFNRPLPDKS